MTTIKLYDRISYDESTLIKEFTIDSDNVQSLKIKSSKLLQKLGKWVVLGSSKWKFDKTTGVYKRSAIHSEIAFTPGN